MFVLTAAGRSGSLWQLQVNAELGHVLACGLQLPDEQLNFLAVVPIGVKEA